MTDLAQLIDFISLLHKFQQEKRAVFATGENRYENDAEHSYELAMAAWYIIDSKKLDLNRDLAVKYAMIHDFAEVYAGDTPVFYAEERRKTKAEREEQAMHKIESEFREAGPLWETWKNYELRNDPESRFIYALDKVMPMLNIYLDGGRSWKEGKVTFQMDYNHKKDKVLADPEVKHYFDELVKILEIRQGDLFHTEKLS